MMLSLGAGGYTAAIFHLLAHGFAKALLFLGAGSVIHSTEKQEISELGGLRRVMPITTIVFAIGAASLGGIPILAGFWSKDEILQSVSHGLNPAFIVLALVTALLSALYMGRAVFVTFFGRMPQDLEHTHESPPVMTVPLALLAILAIGFGLISWNWPGAFGGFGTFVFVHKPHAFEFTWWIGILSAVMAVGAFVLTYLVYERGSISLEGTRQRFAAILKVVENKYYFDEIYQWVIDRIVLVVANFVGFFDRAIVNDVGINGPADAVRRLGITLRLHVTGHLYSYALAMVLGTVGLGIFWWLVTS